MPNPGQIGPREREILTAIVETYIATGEPVGSRTLSRHNKDGLSPATIRNVMSDLADGGFLEQPHTSAGRIPTSQAYRYYVDQISGKATISAADQTLISDTLQGTVDVQEFLERTSHVLSLVSSGVGVAIGNAGPKNALEHVYFSRQGNNRVLAVVVTKSGVVHDRMMRLAVKELLLSDRAQVIPDGPGPSSDDGKDLATVVLAQLSNGQRDALLEKAAHIREVLTGYRSGSPRDSGRKSHDRSTRLTGRSTSVTSTRRPNWASRAAPSR